MEKTSVVSVDDISAEISSMFDYTFSGTVTTTIPEIDVSAIPKGFGVGLLVGSSGSGKSTLLSSCFGEEESIEWRDDMAICSHFDSAGGASSRLSAVGLNSIPSWMKPYAHLSTGERFRADLARRLKDGAVIDEFTSTVDRNVAKACSKSLGKYIDRSGIKGVVLASCHRDIVEWLQPDWVFDTDTGKLSIRGSVRRFPVMHVTLEPCEWKEWAAFQQHHYLSASANKSAWFWLVQWNGQNIGICSAIPFPCGSIKNAYREHRTVILPDFQGLGIGVRVSDEVGRMMLSVGKRYFSKTSHPRMGEYRENSPLWRPTSKNRKARKDYESGMTGTKEDKYKHLHAKRVCFSHEFVGP